jgi:hypothetical protein
VCHTDRVGLTLLEPLLTTIGMLSFGVFLLVFKFVAPEVCQRGEQRFEPVLPRAATHVTGHAAGARWLRGLGQERLLACIRLLQIAIVAVGMTAAFVMFLCMAGVMASMLMGSL